MDPDEEVRQILARAEELLVLGKVLDALEQVPQTLCHLLCNREMHE